MPRKLSANGWYPFAVPGAHYTIFDDEFHKTISFDSSKPYELCYDKEIYYMEDPLEVPADVLQVLVKRSPGLTLIVGDNTVACSTEPFHRPVAILIGVSDEYIFLRFGEREQYGPCVLGEQTAEEIQKIFPGIWTKVFKDQECLLCVQTMVSGPGPQTIENDPGEDGKELSFVTHGIPKAVLTTMFTRLFHEGSPLGKRMITVRECIDADAGLLHMLGLNVLAEGVKIPKKDMDAMKEFLQKSKRSVKPDDLDSEDEEDGEEDCEEDDEEDGEEDDEDGDEDGDEDDDEDDDEDGDATPRGVTPTCSPPANRDTDPETSDDGNAGPKASIIVTVDSDDEAEVTPPLKRQKSAGAK
jgi:hypothetical protein